MAIQIGEEKSIIEIIERMVKEGEPEEKIIASLKALGIKENQAKKLLLLGEADTFTLLKSEIRKIVREDIKKEEELLKEVIIKLIHEEERKIEENTAKNLEELKISLGEKIRKAEKEEGKKSKMREIMRLLDSPETTHGIKYDGTSKTERTKVLKKRVLKELKL
ncbi:MAG: hypothetical protein ABIE23_02180 [archaeon]